MTLHRPFLRRRLSRRDRSGRSATSGHLRGFPTAALLSPGPILPKVDRRNRPEPAVSTLPAHRRATISCSAIRPARSSPPSRPTRTGASLLRGSTDPNSTPPIPTSASMGTIFQAATETVNGTPGQRHDHHLWPLRDDQRPWRQGQDRRARRQRHHQWRRGQGQAHRRPRLRRLRLRRQAEGEERRPHHRLRARRRQNPARPRHLQEAQGRRSPGKEFFAGNNVDEGKEAKDLVVYDEKSGKLWYDKDGAGGAHAKLVAIIDHAPNLNADDFSVIA